MEKVFEITSGRLRSACGRRSRTPRSEQVQLRRAGHERLDRRFALQGLARPGPLVKGESLEVDPPRPLVQSMRALWGEDVKEEGTSRVTWEIEPSATTPAG